MADVKPIPDGYPRVTPYLHVDGADAAIDFYTKVLGAKERMRMGAPEGRVGHAELMGGYPAPAATSPPRRSRDPPGHRVQRREQRRERPCRDPQRPGDGGS